MPLLVALALVVLQACVRADPPLPQGAAAAGEQLAAPAPPAAPDEPAVAPSDAAAPGQATEPTEAIDDGDAIEPTPAADPGDALQAAYQACRERVEGDEADGECASDAGCAAQGCSGEVCAPAGSGLMTTCEVLPCYEVLQSCGCRAGRCQWTVGARAGSRDVPRPTRKLP